MAENGKRLKAARLAAGYKTASDAARALGMPIPTVIAHEGRGTSYRKPKAADLLAYAKAYKVPVGELADNDRGRRRRAPAEAQLSGVFLKLEAELPTDIAAQILGLVTKHEIKR